MIAPRIERKGGFAIPERKTHAKGETATETVLQQSKPPSLFFSISILRPILSHKLSRRLQEADVDDPYPPAEAGDILRHRPARPVHQREHILLLAHEAHARLASREEGEGDADAHEPGGRAEAHAEGSAGGEGGYGGEFF